MKAIRLRCEYRENPLGIDTPAPRFSWWLDTEDPEASGVSQTAYQIVVKDGDKTVWDSGRVESSQNIQVDYAGRKLQSGHGLRWRVRVWNQDHQRSEFSDPATFTMGLLQPHDWQAKWIASPALDGSGQMPIFRASFRLDQPVTRTVAFYCGLGQHELSINGQLATEDIIDPGWTNYKKTCLYATHDVTSLVKQGDNSIAMMLGNGMYNVLGGRYVKFKGSFGPPKLIFQLHVDFEDGTSKIITSDDTWQTAPGPITFSSIYGGEDYDARTRTTENRRLATGANHRWPRRRIAPQSQPPIRVMQTFKPIRKTEVKPGVIVYDLGQNMSGRPRITIRGNAGDKVTLKTGENRVHARPCRPGTTRRAARPRQCRAAACRNAAPAPECWTG